jgi:hypothetical protein
LAAIGEPTVNRVYVMAIRIEALCNLVVVEGSALGLQQR